MSNSSIQGQECRSLFKLYSKDGKRTADVLEFRNGETYVDEQEWVEGTTFKNRHSGSLVGPFNSPTDAEVFILATPWFCGDHARTINKRRLALFGALPMPSWYRRLCETTAFTGWLPILFTSSVIHGGTVATEAIAWGGMVLGGYCSIELVRMGAEPWFKSPALFGCIAYGAMVGVHLYFGWLLI